MSDGGFDVVDAPSADDMAVLGARLGEFNASVTAIGDGRLIGVFVRAGNGELTAGLHGHTWGGTCEVSRLWVSEAMRRRGLGSQLMQAAEEEARGRGCRQMFLSTYTFQAPGFYERLGFEEVGRVSDYPVGHYQVFMVKRLV